MNKFDRTVGSFLPKGESKKLIKNYAERFPFETKFALFGKDIIDQLLKVEGCEGIRISFALNEDGHIKPILHSINSNGGIIENSEDANASVLCPPFCPGTEITPVP